MPIINFDYELAQTELETIIDKLESDDIGMEESILLYKKGTELYKSMKDYIETCTAEIEIYNSDLNTIELLKETKND